MTDGQSKAVQKKDMGIAGVVIVIAQCISTFQSSHSMSEEFSKLKEEVQQSKVEREQYFVRKTELSPVMTKLDKLSTQMTQLNQKVANLSQEFDEANLYGAEGGDHLVGCSVDQVMLPVGLKI